MSEPSTPTGRFLNDNGLSLALMALFVLTLAGQAATGWWAYDAARVAARLAGVGFAAYLGTGNFLDGLFSNWQAAVLQLAVLISLGAVLRQKGATHSRQPGDDDDPGRGDHGWVYAHSLALAFAALFAVTFAGHLVCGAMKYNEDQALQHLPPVDLGTYAASPAFWFSAFQCWEAEFAVIGIYVVFSIFLRQEASPESKPVDASDEQTGGANE
ncbi:DUF6766 family protein [Sphingomonas sp.]|uniref:DUF6766 family protein n=1 Tax=Sphingomonas sp. TaxID=28214 RepID=UPI003B007BBE